MSDRRWTGLLVALAIVARAAAVLVLQSHTVPRSTYEHGEIAANLLAGRGFAIRFLGAEGPTSQQAPLYPVLVAAAYAIGGVETPRSLWILELTQAALGGVLVLGVLALARALAPDRPWFGRAAALLVALHPTLVYSATHVQVAPWAATMLVWTLVIATRLGQSGRVSGAVALGTLGALLTLTDPILALIAPAAAWAVVQGRGSLAASWKPLTLASAVAVLGVAPWIARNHAVHGELVFIKSTFGYAFWQGNCALSQGTDKVLRPTLTDQTLAGASTADLKGWNAALWQARHQAGYLDDIALSREDRAALGQLSEPERSRVLFRRALAELTPGRYLRLCLQRLRYFVLFDETNPKTRNLTYRVSHLGLTLLAALGVRTMGPAQRRRLAPTFLAAGLLTLFHTLTIVSARFHLPLEPLLAVWAAAPLARTGRRRPGSTASGSDADSAAAADGVVGVGVVELGLARAARRGAAIGPTGEDRRAGNGAEHGHGRHQVPERGAGADVDGHEAHQHRHAGPHHHGLPERPRATHGRR